MPLGPPSTTSSSSSSGAAGRAGAGSNTTATTLALDQVMQLYRSAISLLKTAYDATAPLLQREDALVDAIDKLRAFLVSARTVDRSIMVPSSSSKRTHTLADIVTDVQQKLPMYVDDLAQTVAARQRPAAGAGAVRSAVAAMNSNASPGVSAVLQGDVASGSAMAPVTSDPLGATGRATADDDRPAAQDTSIKHAQGRVAGVVPSSANVGSSKPGALSAGSYAAAGGVGVGYSSSSKALNPAAAVGSTRSSASGAPLASAGGPRVGTGAGSSWASGPSSRTGPSHGGAFGVSGGVGRYDSPMGGFGFQPVTTPVGSWFEDKFIFFYEKDELYYEFTNFFRRPLKIDDDTWPSSEHYFQANKFPGNRDLMRRCRDAPTARDVFQLARENDRFKRPDWEEAKEGVMYRALMVKYGDHSDLGMLLLGTGNAHLVEASPVDGYWGYGKDRSGLNRLGVLLMAVRDELRKKYPMPRTAPTVQPQNRLISRHLPYPPPAQPVAAASAPPAGGAQWAGVPPQFGTAASQGQPQYNVDPSYQQQQQQQTQQQQQQWQGQPSGAQWQQGQPQGGYGGPQQGQPQGGYGGPQQGQPQGGYGGAQQGQPQGGYGGAQQYQSPPQQVAYQAQPQGAYQGSQPGAYVGQGQPQQMAYQQGQPQQPYQTGGGQQASAWPQQQQQQQQQPQQQTQQSYMYAPQQQQQQQQPR